LNSLGRDMAIGCFPEASLFNHSCQPNATFHLDVGGAREIPRCTVPGLVVRITENVAKGCELCISYTDVFASKAERHNHLRGFHFTCTCVRCSSEKRALRSPADAPQQSLLQALQGLNEGWTDASTLWKCVVEATTGVEDEGMSFGAAGLRSRAVGALVAYFLNNLERGTIMSRKRPRHGGPPFDPRFVASIFEEDLARRRKYFGERALAQIGYVRVCMALVLLDSSKKGTPEIRRNRDELELSLLLCAGMSLKI